MNQVFKCSVCGYAYSTEEDAASCGARTVSHDKGARVGDTVRILLGEGAGELATIERVRVAPREWGYYLWERFWHTVVLTVRFNDGGFYRELTFEDYEVVK